MALQMAVDIASAGRNVLYLALEQSLSDLKDTIDARIFPYRREVVFPSQDGPQPFEKGLEKAKSIIESQTRSEAEEDRASKHLDIDSSVNGMEGLPDFFVRQVLRKGKSQYPDLIFVDSIQGFGSAPTSSKLYENLYKFNRYAKEHRITVILIGHVTKGGAIAGPKTLEHNVDCVFYLRKAMRLRPLFVPKNRFGPERHEPLSLIMSNPFGCLEKSKHAKAQASSGYGYLPRYIDDFIEVQALVKLPKFGEKPGTKAPYLPRQKLKQLIDIISNLHDIDISDMTFEINCAIPGRRPYSETLDLPLVMSILSSYFQEMIPPGSLFVGEVDLFQKIRPLGDGQLHDLGDKFTEEILPVNMRQVKQIFLSKGNEEALQDILYDKGVEFIEVIGVEYLEELVERIWPDIVE